LEKVDPSQNDLTLTWYYIRIRFFFPQTEQYPYGSSNVVVVAGGVYHIGVYYKMYNGGRFRGLPACVARWLLQ